MDTAIATGCWALLEFLEEEDGLSLFSGGVVGRLLIAGESAGIITIAPVQALIPCDSQGRPLEQIINNSNRQQLLPELTVNHYFSAKACTGRFLGGMSGDRTKLQNTMLMLIGRCR